MTAKTETQRCLRLLGALEDLLDQEATCLHAKDFVAVQEIQARTAPLVTALAEEGPAVLTEELRGRVAALVSRREKSVAWLQEELTATRERLQNLDATGRRVGQIAPVYGKRAGVRSRLSAVG